MSAMGQTRTSSLGAARPLPPSADIGPGGQSVGQAAQFCLALCAAAEARAAGAHRLTDRNCTDAVANGLVNSIVFSPFIFRQRMHSRPARGGMAEVVTTMHLFDLTHISRCRCPAQDRT